MIIKNNEIKGGLRGGTFRPLSDEGIKRIHKASMRVFEKTGVKVLSERALLAFKSAGAEVDIKTMMVRASETWVLDKLKTAPSNIVLYGREERHNLYLDGTRVYLGTGGTALNVLDIDTGKRRPSVLDDIHKTARLVDALDNIHFYVIPCYPSDVKKNDVDANRFFASFKNTTKHVMGGIYTKEGLLDVYDMAVKIAGSKEALVREPFVSFITCIMSPLIMEKNYTDLMITAVETGLPLATPAAPMAGSTSPATLAGTLVQMNVEALSGVLLTQIINPGHPVLYSCVPTTTDLRTGTFCFGSIETGIMNAASAQLSRYYKLPDYTTAGVNDSKIPDIQSGYESMATALMTSLAGSNYIHDAAGLLESGLSIAYEQYVIDDDILGMCMRAVKGIEITDESLATDIISDVGPGGNYLSHEHTIMNMKSEFFYPRAADRNNWPNWTGNGSLDGREKAKKLARDILAGHKPKGIDIKVEEQIISDIPGLVQEKHFNESIGEYAYAHG